jgi:hypothetical protein
MSSSAILNLRRKMDARSGGRMPVLVETPTVGLVVPQVAKDGALRSVALVNARIDEQKPVKLRLRGVPDGVETARWWQLRGKPVTLPVERLGGGEAIVVVPALSAWNCGWLAI